MSPDNLISDIGHGDFDAVCQELDASYFVISAENTRIVHIETRLVRHGQMELNCLANAHIERTDRRVRCCLVEQNPVPIDLNKVFSDKLTLKCWK